MSATTTNTATRDVILTVARAKFAERGYAAATLRGIARGAGVTQPLIYHYFDSKQLLFEAVLEDALTGYVAAQAEQWELADGDLRFITRGMVVLFEWLGSSEEMIRLMTWARLEGYEHMSSLGQEIGARVKLHLEALGRRDMLLPGTDIDMVMAMIDAMFKGFWDRRSSYEEHYGAQELRFLAQCARTIYFGLLTPEAAQLALEMFEGFLAETVGERAGAGHP